MSAELLRRAADKLDQIGRCDTYVRVRSGRPHKPEIIEADVIRDVSTTNKTVGIEVVKAIEVTVDGVPFGPQVAAPLAEWLRYDARLYDVHARDFVDSTTPEVAEWLAGLHRYGLALARAILAVDQS